MADRYQGRTFPGGNDFDRDDAARASDKAESDPLAELARLIGQTDPFGTAPIQRANLPLQPHARAVDPTPSYDNHDNYESYDEAPAEPEEPQPPGPPAWMQHAARHEPTVEPQDDYPSAVHPLHRYAAAHPPAVPNYDPDQLFADQGHQPDPTRYDDALYGGYDSDAQRAQHDHAYDDYAYDEEQNYEPEPEPRRRGGMVTVVAVLALAVFGVGGAFAYRTYTGAGRGGEPPVILAAPGPTKVVAAPADGATKVPDRMATGGDGGEKLVPREEAPVDLNRSGPRVVFPPLTPNGNVPMPSTIVPGGAPPSATANGTLPNNEPHRIKTFSVRGDQTDSGAPAGATPPPAAKPAATARTGAPAQRAPATTNPSAANANAPLSLAPQASAAPEPPARVANNAPAPIQVAPATPSASAASGNYLVQVSSQRSEADAQASYRALQSKYPSVLGSQSVVVKRVDLGEKGVYYRAFAGPFSSADQATQVCSSLKSAGGPQCLIQRN